MRAPRDQMWVDSVQFDTRRADSVWDGDLDDPDAPGWCASLSAAIRRARGPARPGELAHEGTVVALMQRARRPIGRRLARVVAAKGAAAATAATVTVSAAAAATGIVAVTTG